MHILFPITMKTMLDTRINDYSIFQLGSLLLNRYIYMKNKFKTQQTKFNLYKKNTQHSYRKKKCTPVRQNRLANNGDLAM